MLNNLKAVLAVGLMLTMCVASDGAAIAAERKSVVSAQKKQTNSAVLKKVRPSPAKKAKPSPAARKAPARKTTASTPSAWQETRKLAVQSSSALVIEQNGGASLYQKNADVVAPIASITKLMTAMVELDSSPNLQVPITITEDDVDTLRGSRSRLHVGSAMSLESALLLALMSSENRAANALARHYPGGIGAFVAAMNIKAQALGLRDTHFEDATGLTSNNVSTARDLARMVIAAYRYPLIRELTTTAEATVAVGGREMDYRNTNPLVKSTAWDVGLSKTGYIHEAGKCLVMQARVAERPVVIVLLDSAGKLTRVGDANRIRRWMESVHAASGTREKTVLSRAVSDGPG